MTRVLALALAGLLAGCASVVRGTEEDVAVDVQPPHATVQTSLGKTCTGSCVLKMPRKKSLTVVASAPGYHPQSVAVGTKMSGGGTAGMAGNILFGGVIGVGV